MPPDSSVPDPTVTGPASLNDPLYYLHNFRWVLSWVVSRYPEMLEASEKSFVKRLGELPVASQGLLVRMVMRKGEYFRGDKLAYPELGITSEAVRPLIEQGWVTQSPSLSLETLFSLFTWPELRRALAEPLEAAGVRRARKTDALAVLAEQSLAPAAPEAWGFHSVSVYRLNLMPLCDRFRLMFFGNMDQDWTEFVLAELGTYTYQKVDFNLESRPFHCREEVDAYLALQVCREDFYAEEPLTQVERQLPELPSANPWLVRVRDKLLFKIAREWERAGELGHACQLYQQSSYPQARGRLMRALECDREYELALRIAEYAFKAPVDEAERQQLQRLIPRLQRKLGLPPMKRSVASPVVEFTLTLPRAGSVEQAVQRHLSSDDAPTFYVENALLTGLFGLLCWNAIFSPVPGAFFHPYQRGPADLYWPGFYERRKAAFDRCLALLDTSDHIPVVLNTFREKYGYQCHFVHWNSLTGDLLEQALLAIPAIHLKCIFQRFLQDIKANCAGLPDLIQLGGGQGAGEGSAPRVGRYRMIEVKGPGDRLQDNQRRWLDYFATHKLPVAVCYVEWAEEWAEEQTTLD